jgi:hypothetical protein
VAFREDPPGCGCALVLIAGSALTLVALLRLFAVVAT